MTTRERPSLRPRVLLYTHDRYGLGHLRRTLSIAAEVARRRPETAMLLLTGASPPEEFERPPALDYVKLPSTAHADLYPAPSDAARGAPAPGLVALRTALIRESVRAFVPHVVVVEHLPLGFWSELRDALTGLRAAQPTARIFLGLRDVPDPAAQVRDGWRAGGQFAFIERLYDGVLIYGDRTVFDPVRECGFPPAVAAKSTYCGYVSRPPSAAAEDVRLRLGAGPGPLVVVTTGGGLHGGALLRAYLEACRAGALPGVTSFLTLGPRLATGERGEIEAAAAELPRVRVVPFVADLGSYLGTADAVVTMAGYNTTVEVLRLGKRAVFVPRPGPDQEQAVRAERLAALGLGRLVRPEALTPGRLAEAVRAALAAPPAPVGLDFGGLSRAGELVAAALG